MCGETSFGSQASTSEAVHFEYDSIDMATYTAFIQETDTSDEERGASIFQHVQNILATVERSAETGELQFSKVKWHSTEIMPCSSIDNNDNDNDNDEAMEVVDVVEVVQEEYIDVITMPTDEEHETIRAVLICAANGKPPPPSVIDIDPDSIPFFIENCLSPLAEDLLPKIGPNHYNHVTIGRRAVNNATWKHLQTLLADDEKCLLIFEQCSPPKESTFYDELNPLNN